MPSDIYRLSRETDSRERDNPPHPLPPLNMFVSSPDIGMMDIRWDNPSLITGNGMFTIYGVNIYRSYDSQWSNYTKINVNPVGSLFYRDSTQNQLVSNDDVTNNFTAFGSNSPNGQYVIKVDNFPIVKDGTQAVVADHPSDVVLRIDGVIVPVASVRGFEGEVLLNQARVWDSVNRKLIQPVLPTGTSTVTLTYQYNTTIISAKLNQRIFYKITSVGEDSEGNPVETPVNNVEGVSAFEFEKLDYIWKEAIRRNRWILEQGGEAVKLFIRKWMGVRCECYSYTHRQAENDCLLCFGTGIQGGYEGPFDILISPQDGERRVEINPNGMNVLQQYEVWTGPTPLLSQRDFVVKQNNDRYSIGGVSIPSNRGNVLQQHFAIGYFDESVVRYQVPANADALANLAYPQTRYTNWESAGEEGFVYPQITDNTDPQIQKPAQDRGRTPTYGRIVR